MSDFSDAVPRACEQNKIPMTYMPSALFVLSEMGAYSILWLVAPLSLVFNGSAASYMVSSPGLFLNQFPKTNLSSRCRVGILRKIYRRSGHGLCFSTSKLQYVPIMSARAPLACINQQETKTCARFS
jgi:hypothetical protein